MRGMRAVLLAGAALAGGLPAANRSEAAPLAFADLPGWAEDDQSAALETFRKSCGSSPALRPACGAAARVAGGDAAGARRFFETWFEPADIAARGFLTAYFEPELAGSQTPDATFRVPLLARPAGLAVRGAAPVPAGWPAGMTAALRSANGYAALPDRGAIEDGALGGSAAPIIYLRDPVDAFIVHVQGSARIRLADGRTVRVGFDGRNGHPYTAIARVLAEQEGVSPAAMTADRLWSWLKANPDRAPAIMRQNRSFIFFRLIEARPETGPVGAAGVPLTSGRSLAVDRRTTAYGTPVWLAGELPRPGGGREPLHRLVIAQDTGAAIVGQARGDLFLGSGAAAGEAAALVRDPVRWVVLRPKRRLAIGRPGRHR